MVTRIIIFALIAGVVYLNYTVPKIEDHKAFLLEELQIGYALNEEQQEKLWKKVKEKGTHLHYFPTFDALKEKVHETLSFFENAKEEVLSLVGMYQALA